jgi:hypothetical protein
MMTQNEIVDLLSVVTAYDNRNASKAAVLAWGTASEIGRWTFPEALRSVHEHYAESTDFIMPAHVTRRIKTARNDFAMRNPTDPPDKTGQARLGRMLAGAFKTVGDD